MSCPFTVLGLSPDANRDEVRKAYHELARKYHPDRAGSASGARMQKINAAYKDALRMLEGGHFDFTRYSQRSHESRAQSSYHGSSRSTSRREPANSTSGFRSEYGDQRSEQTSKYSDNYDYGESSRTYSSRHRGTSSRDAWSSRLPDDISSAGYGGRFSARNSMDWIADAKARKIKEARDVETEFGFQSRRLERLDKHSSRDRDQYNRIMSDLSSIEKRLEACVARVEEFQEWIDEGKDMGYFE